MKVIITVLCLCFVFSEQLMLQRSTPQDASYVAAVVEYEVNASVEDNIQNYIRHIQDAAQQDADIVVFPEMTLTRGNRAADVPIRGLLQQFPIPALEPSLYDEILVNMSLAARQNQVYVVINIQERLDCTLNNTGEPCPEAKVYMFNTNVVFDRSGAIIDRYRKINLFGEFTRNPALSPDLGMFDTDFGVTFGHFICFDLMFQVPAIQVVEKMAVKDIIFTTMWFSEIPYLTAVQIQESYAYTMNVNFIASGANNVGVGSAGSGIYSGKAGALISIMPGVPTTRLLVSRVPKNPGQVNFPVTGPIYDDPRDHDGLRLISDPSLPSHTSKQLEPGFQEFSLTDKEVSCKFTARLNIRAEMNHVYHYRAFVQDGLNVYSRRHAGVSGCVITACLNSRPTSCGIRYSRTDTNAKFKELQIVMTTHRYQYNDTLKCDNVVYFPSSMRHNHFPLSTMNTTFMDSTQNGALLQNGREVLIYKISAPQNDLASFGIYGRIYTRDFDTNITVTEKDILDYIELENGIFINKAFGKKED